jgi:hypothetical protein
MSIIDNRATALSRAQDLLPKDADATDRIIVADWLMTGKIDAALQFAEQSAKLYPREDSPIRIMDR